MGNETINIHLIITSLALAIFSAIYLFSSPVWLFPLIISVTNSICLCIGVKSQIEQTVKGFCVKVKDFFETLLN